MPDVRAATRDEFGLSTSSRPSAPRESATIQPADVRAWVARLSASGLAPDTVKAVYLTFRQLMKTAEIYRLIALRPARR